MKYLLILSGYEDQVSFWEKMTSNVPSIDFNTMDIVCYPEFLRHAEKTEKATKSWLESVKLAARQVGIELPKEINYVQSIAVLKKMLALTECAVFSHNILSELHKKSLLNEIKGSIISFDSNFESVERCVIVFDKKVKSIKNFNFFFNHFAGSIKNSEVVLLMEIGKTLSEANKNKKAVSYLVKLFKSVGVITYPTKDLQNEISRYLSLNKNSVLIFHKSNYQIIVDSKFRERLQNRKIAYYLDEF